MSTQTSTPAKKPVPQLPAPSNGSNQQTEKAQEQAPARGTIRDLLERSRDKFAQVIPKHLDVDRLIRVTVACIARTPALQKCSQTSLLNAVMTAAQLGLEPTGVLGSAYLVPYKSEVQLIVGYRGLIDLARRSGQIESIEAHVVHANDRFRLSYGLDPKLEHEPAWEGEPGALKAVYAIAKLKDGGKQIEVMTKTQVDGIRARSKAGGNGPWVTDYEEMARKTVVRRICKYLPLTPEMIDAFTHEEEQERIDGETAAAVATGVVGLKQIAQAKAATLEAQKVEEQTAPQRESEPGLAEPPDNLPDEPPITFGDEEQPTT